MNPINPKSFTITDAAVAAEAVTGFRVLLSQTDGGPYSLQADVPLADVTVDPVAGTYTGKLDDLHLQLAKGTWYAVAQAVNANGASANSPRTVFDIVPPLPSAPTGFEIA